MDHNKYAFTIRGGKAPRLAPDHEPTFYEDTYLVVHELGGPQKVKHYPAHMLIGSYCPQELRRLSPLAQEHIRVIDAHIADLYRAREAFIQENFASWPLVTPQDPDVKHISGETRAQANKRLREMGG